jgi:hypothetical protein
MLQALLQRNRNLGFAVVTLPITTVALVAGCHGGPCPITRDPNCDPTKNSPCPVVCVDQTSQSDVSWQATDDAEDLDGGDNG